MKRRLEKGWLGGNITVILFVTCSFISSAQTPKTTKNEYVALNTIEDNKHITTEVIIEDSTTSDYNKVYAVTEKMPQFSGGNDSLLAFIRKNILLDKNIDYEHGIPGKVIVRFIVTKSGAVTHVEVVRSLGPACDKEAIRVTKLLPDFIPGEHYGVKVAVYYTLPIIFRP